MKTGFVPALGTPLDEKGELLEDSYKKEIEMMIGCGAVGLLSMGSMGIGYSVAAEPPFRRGEYRKTGIAYRRV